MALMLTASTLFSFVVSTNSASAMSLRRSEPAFTSFLTKLVLTWTAILYSTGKIK